MITTICPHCQNKIPIRIDNQEELDNIMFLPEEAVVFIICFGCNRFYQIGIAEIQDTLRRNYATQKEVPK
jgi:hypothetical protein